MILHAIKQQIEIHTYLVQIEVPDNVKDLEKEAFNEVVLEEVKLPEIVSKKYTILSKDN